MRLRTLENKHANKHTSNGLKTQHIDLEYSHENLSLSEVDERLTTLKMNLNEYEKKTDRPTAVSKLPFFSSFFLSFYYSITKIFQLPHFVDSL